MKKKSRLESFWELIDMRGFYLDWIRGWPMWAKLLLTDLALIGLLIYLLL